MENYKIVLFWSHADKRFIANAPELGDISATGKTQSQALANIVIEIQRYMDSYKSVYVKKPNSIS